MMCQFPAPKMIVQMTYIPSVNLTNERYYVGEVERCMNLIARNDPPVSRTRGNRDGGLTLSDAE